MADEPELETVDETQINGMDSRYYTMPNQVGRFEYPDGMTKREWLNGPVAEAHASQQASEAEEVDRILREQDSETQSE